jgi:DNA replication and repair protein RecF
VIKVVALNDFRNYERGRIEFKEGINAVISGNGCGKTNLLEAVFLLLEGRSIRGADAREMIREQAEKASVAGLFEEGREINLKLILGEDGSIKGKKRPEELGAVCFQPDDIWMVKGGPEVRRKYLDEMIVDIKKGYRETLKEYGRVLRQRNEAIKAVRKGARGREYMRNWNSLLLNTGGEVVAERRNALANIAREMAPLAEAWGLGKLGIRYYSSMGEEGEEPEKIAGRVERVEDAEIRRGSTLIGPHRDEVLFVLNEKSVRRKASQGQQKLITILWRISQGRLIEKQRGKRILPLMDDCLSELDEANRGVVMAELGNWKQAVLTATDDLRELDGANKIWLGREGESSRVAAGGGAA